jgi:hypothetical protein
MNRMDTLSLLALGGILGTGGGGLNASTSVRGYTDSWPKPSEQAIAARKARAEERRQRRNAKRLRDSIRSTAGKFF